ncbi:hypothetical protein GCM10009557_77380 [Virgisporangium ochraceum]
MLEQERLIARVRDLCAADDRLDAALMYGSFAAGTADAHSDLEFWLFFTRGDADPRAWCGEVAPLMHLVRNESGAHVAVFPGLVRGEFHFATTDDIAGVGTWPARGAPVERMLVVDRLGRLRPVLESLPEHPAPPSAEDVCGRFANWLLLAHHVAARGEHLRAWDALGHVHRHLLWMARLAHGSTTHWLTPSRHAEVDLPAGFPADLRLTTASAEPAEVRRALREAWRLGRTYWTDLTDRHGTAVPDALFADLDRALPPDPT